MSTWWRRIFRPVVSMALSPRDTFEEEERKWVYIPFFICAAFVYFLFKIGHVLTDRFHIFSIAEFGWHIALLAYVMVTKRLPRELMELHFCLAGLHVPITVDLRNGGKYDLWTGMMVIMDVLLLTRCHGRPVVFLRTITVAYLGLKSLEDVIQFGLYTHIPNSSHDDRGCAPLSARVGLGLFLVRCAVFLLDFNLTSRFATGMFTEQERMRNVIRTAEDIASALVLFDLDSAERALEERGEEGPLRDALRSLLHNLRCYRPYLPDSLFASDVVESPHFSRGPPEGEVAVVFTDIQSSTELWESCGDVMHHALRVHNSVVRQCIRKWRGYEVKTIGDAFMVTFDTAHEAVRFAMDTQGDLLRADWMNELLEHPLCMPTSDGPWRGLRVRIGIHYGEVEKQVNPVTLRADYVGPTVNVAARVEGLAKGGTVLVTQRVIESLTPDTLDGLVVKRLGGYSLKGVSESVDVHLIMSQGMEGRDRSDHEHETVSRGSVSTTRHMIEDIDMLRVQLRRQYATVGCVRMECTAAPLDVGAAANLALTSVISCSERTEGTVVAICSSNIILAWNTGRPCVSHVSRAVDFLAFMYTGGAAATVGLVSGPTLHGNVGSERQRFVTVLGQCVDLSVWLAGCAADFPTMALVASVPPYHGVADDLVFRKVVRKVDEMAREQHGVNEVIDIYEVNCAALDSKGFEPEGWGWSDACREAIASKAWHLLEAQGDPGLTRIAEVGLGKATLRYTLPCNRLADPPLEPDIPWETIDSLPS